jgi:hypothetical protein
MVGKYLEEDCLCVKDQKAVEKLHELLNMEPTPVSSRVECNKSHKRRAEFLSKVKKRT